MTLKEKLVQFMELSAEVKTLTHQRNDLMAEILREFKRIPELTQEPGDAAPEDFAFRYTGLEHQGTTYLILIGSTDYCDGVPVRDGLLIYPLPSLQ